MIENGVLHLAQEDGALPATLAAGSAPGESGVSVLRTLFLGAAHLRAMPTCHHLVCFLVTPQVRFHCRVGGQVLSHVAPAGSVAVLPAGVDSAADADESAEALFVAVDMRQLSLAAAEDAVLGARLNERLSGEDRALFDLACTLAAESVQGYPEGSLFWNDVACGFVHALVGRHTARSANAQKRGTLGDHALVRIREYVLDHLGEPIEVAALADIAGRSPFHFSRVFARSVGVTPHRYVVHLRLRRAIELIRDGRCSLAEIAVRTGFADQSHLSRWIRRVRGVSPAQLVG